MSVDREKSFRLVMAALAVGLLFSATKHHIETSGVVETGPIITPLPSGQATPDPHSNTPLLKEVTRIPLQLIDHPACHEDTGGKFITTPLDPGEPVIQLYGDALMQLRPHYSQRAIEQAMSLEPHDPVLVFLNGVCGALLNRESIGPGSVNLMDLTYQPPSTFPPGTTISFSTKDIYAIQEGLPKWNR